MPSLSFGLGPSAGVHDACADAANGIMRAEGIGPIIKWVDDRIFFRMPKAALAEFNANRAELHTQITQNGGRHHHGGRWWYHAGNLPDARIIECDEDMSLPLQDYSSLGYPMEEFQGRPVRQSSDTSDSSGILYIAQYHYHLTKERNTGPPSRIGNPAPHTHSEAKYQSLYGKLLHSCLNALTNFHRKFSRLTISNLYAPPENPTLTSSYGSRPAASPH